MKLHLPSPLRAALLASLAFSSSLYAGSYVVEGVSADGNELASTRFYDGGKGCYWEFESLESSVTTLLNQNGSYQFLGDLYSYIPAEYQGKQTEYKEEAFVNLTDDADTCWAYSSANLIQYWQTYYGVFSSKLAQMPHGYTYDKEHLEALGGTQSLKLNMFIYDNWLNEGGSIAWMAPWYFNGTPTNPDRMKSSFEEAGFFSEYFTSPDWASVVDFHSITTNTTLGGFSELLAQSLGFTRSAEEGADSYKLTSKGLIAYIGLQANEADAGHAITCYGLSTDENGNVVSMQIANSDDKEYALITLYVKQVGGNFNLYTDKECRTLWKYANFSWYIDEVANIKTPESLRMMLEEYSDEEKPLYWNGKLISWNNNAAYAEDDAIPTASTGWEAAAGTGTEHEGRFAIHYNANRAVVFDDRAGERGGTVALGTDVVTPSMTVNNDDVDYTFIGSVRTLHAGRLEKSGSGKLTFNCVKYTAPTTEITGGLMELSNNSVLTGTSVTLTPPDAATAVLRFDGATANLTGAMTVNRGATLDFARNTTLVVADINTLADSTISLTVGSGNVSTAVLSLTGNLNIAGLVSLNFNVSNLAASESYTLASVTGSLSVSDLSNMSIHGTAFDASDYTAELALSHDARTLYLKLADAAVFYWEGGNGTWDKSTAVWSSLDDNTEALETYTNGTHARFTNATAAITVGENVNARRLLVENGSYTFTNGERIRVDSRMTLQNGGVFKADNAPTLGAEVLLEIVDSASSFTADNGSLSLKTLSSKGSLTLNHGDLTLHSAVAQGGTVHVSGDVSLAKGTANYFSALTAGSLTLGSGATVSITGDLSAGTINLDAIDTVADIAAGSLTSSALDVVLSANAQQDLRSLGLLHGRSVSLLSLGTPGSATLSIGSAPSINLGDYDYAIGMNGSEVVLTAALHDVVEWTSSDSVWDSDADWNHEAPTQLAGLLGQGTDTIRLSGTKSVGKFVVEAPKDYRLVGEGSLKSGALVVNDGTFSIANTLVSVTGEASVGKEGVLKVEQGSTLQAGSMVLQAENALVNSGTVAVSGALDARGHAITNTGLLSVGAGTRLGYVNGGGSFTVSGGNVSAVSLGDVQELNIAAGASLEVLEPASINGTFSSEGSLVGGTAISFGNVVHAGGHVTAPHIRLAGSGNRFTTLSASTLEYTGELSTASPMVSVESFTMPRTRSALTIILADTDAEQATYSLISTDTGIDASLFTLSPETLLAFRKNKLQAVLRSDGTALYLALSYSDQGIYVAECHSANGTQGGRMLDEVFYELDPQSSPGQNPDLAALLNALDEAIESGNTGVIDRAAAAAAGASIPALGLAYAGDVSRQLRAIRNRTTTMGVDSRYMHPGLPYTNAWINAEGDYRKLEGDGTAAGFSLSRWGGTIGADMDVSEELTLGLACSALYGDFRSTTVEAAKGDLDTCYVSFFGRWAKKSWEHRFVVTGGLADISLNRTVSHGKGSYSTDGETNGYSWGALYELGYTISLAEDNSVCWQPIINASYVHASVDGYTESGSDAALAVGKQDLNQFTIAAGGRLQAVVGESIYNRTSLLELRALAKVDVGDKEGSARTAFAALPGRTAEMESQDYGAVGLELGACLTIPISVNAGEIFIDASTDLRRNYNAVNAAAGWRVHF